MQRLEKGYRKGAVGQMAAYALVGSFVWQRQPASGLLWCMAPRASFYLKLMRLALYALMVESENKQQIAQPAAAGEPFF